MGSPNGQPERMIDKNELYTYIVNELYTYIVNFNKSSFLKY